MAATALVSFAGVLSYTLWYEGVQANIEIFLFFILATGVILFLEERWYFAAALIGIAASMKIFPLALLALFVPKKNWRAIIIGLLSGGLSTLVGLWILCPDLRYAWSRVSAGLALQRDRITLYFDDKAIGFDHSIFAFIKVATEHHFNGRSPTFFPGWMFRYYVLAVALLGVCLWWTKIRKLPTLNQIACLSICSILLPPTSYEYTLLHMYVPWGLIVLYAVDRWRAGENMKFLTPAFLCFAIVFAPMSEIIVKKVNLGAPTFKCAALLYLLYFFLTRPLPGIERIWRGKAVQQRHEEITVT